MRPQLLLKVMILLCTIQLLFVETQSAYAQGAEGQSDAPQFSNCDSIPAADCQIKITVDQFLEQASERWGIQLDEDELFSPASVQRDELPTSIAIVVDGSDVMRRGLLKEVFNSLSNLKEKLLEANPQITDSDIDNLSWSIFFIGAENKDSLYTWCGDIEADDFDEKCDIWRKDSNLPGNTVDKFIRDYAAKPIDATPFVDPLEKVIGYFENRTGPKYIVCFCEGLDGGAQPNVEGTISQAQDNNINIHVIHMWKKVPDKDATEPLKRLAEETGGEFVAIGGDVTPIWQAITRERIDYQYTLTTPLSKQPENVLINYKSDEDKWISLENIPFPAEGLEIIPTDEPQSSATLPPEEGEGGGSVPSSSPLWLWGAIGLGIILFVAAMAVVASRLRNRQKEPDFEPDDDATGRIGTGDFFPPTPPSDRTDSTQRASYVLPVAKLTLKHAPAESRSTLASDITIYSNTLKWGIGRKKANLLKEPEYTDAEPIEIEENTVSRVHALLEFNVEIEGFFLRGDMTPNGTFVNREQLEPLEPYPLQAGDEVQFGKVAYKFEILEMDLRKAFIEFIPPGENGLVIKEVNLADVDQTAR